MRLQLSSIQYAAIYSTSSSPRSTTPRRSPSSPRASRPPSKKTQVCFIRASFANSPRKTSFASHVRIHPKPPLLLNPLLTTYHSFADRPRGAGGRPALRRREPLRQGQGPIALHFDICCLCLCYAMFYHIIL